MVTKIDPKDLPANTRHHIGHIAGNFELSLAENGELRLVCARCRQAFAYPLRGKWAVRAAHLRAHLLRHKTAGEPALTGGLDRGARRPRRADAPRYRQEPLDFGATETGLKPSEGQSPRKE